MNTKAVLCVLAVLFEQKHGCRPLEVVDARARAAIVFRMGGDSNGLPDTL